MGFRKDKIQFSDRQTVKEKNGVKKLISSLLLEDSLSIRSSSLGCFTYFHCHMTLYNGEKLVYDQIDGGLNYKSDIPKSSIDSLSKILETYEILSLKGWFKDYSNRQFRLSRTSDDAYVITGKDTFIKLENPYFFENNPLDEVREILNVNNAFSIAKF